LLALGLQKFAFFGRKGQAVRHYSLERAKGFCEEVERAGRKASVTHLQFIRDEMDRIDTAAFNREIVTALRALPAGTGIFASDDLLAANILQVCRGLGLVVPGHFAVIGFNNEELFCHTTLPPLSSVSYPGEAIGYRAAEILARLFAGENLAGQEWRVSVMGYTERESTNILALTAPKVADAVRIIRNRAPTYPLRVNELLEALDMSYSGLNKLFSTALSTTPKQEINRVRHETFRTLLVTTDWTTERIADHMRFESAEDARRFFRRESGVSASDFRREHQARGPVCTA
jgi:LacI family transcriptional regulator